MAKTTRATRKRATEHQADDGIASLCGMRLPDTEEQDRLPAVTLYIQQLAAELLLDNDGPTPADAALGALMFSTVVLARSRGLTHVVDCLNRVAVFMRGDCAEMDFPADTSVLTGSTVVLSRHTSNARAVAHIQDVIKILEGPAPAGLIYQDAAMTGVTVRMRSR
jgi:hypothetical protein